MKHRSVQYAILALVIVGGLLAAWQLQVRIDRQRTALRTEQDQVLLRSGAAVKHLSLDYAPLMGAIYWTRAVQYFGEKHVRGDRNLELLWPLLDITTTLDPNLRPAYRFGSIFLSDSPPRGAGDPEHAVELLERGIKANPDQWRLYQDLGNVYYFDAKNYDKAAKAYETGSNLPDAYPWMKVMAAKIAAEGESLDTAYYLWQQVYNSTTDQQIRENAETHLRLLKVELDCREIDRAATQYQQKTGHRSVRMSELVEAGLLHGIPADAEGYPYVLGEDGKAELNLNSPLLEEQLANARK